jgi:hypothetical protein
MSKPIRVNQAIKVPDRLTTTFFELPCVKSAIKYENKVCYVILCEAQTRQIAEPGMWLIEQSLTPTYSYWKVVSDEKYQKYFAK